MNTVDRPARLAGIVVDVGLGFVSAVGLAFTAYMIEDSWGGAYWVFNCAAGVVVCLLALLRSRHRAWTAIAGLAVAAVAVVVALVADLPQEPGPVTALALSVLIGSAIRTLPAPKAGAIAAAGFAVVVGTWLSALPSESGFTAVTVLNTVGWLAAVVTGLSLRAVDSRRHANTATVRSSWPEETRPRWDETRTP